jgi:hypothetical protein
MLKYPLASFDGIIESALFRYVFPAGVISRPIQIDAATITTLPVHRQLCRYGDYISDLVKRFEDPFHDGPASTAASTALETGRGILAIYTLIYPPSYPLTGRFLGPFWDLRSRSQPMQYWNSLKHTGMQRVKEIQLLIDPGWNWLRSFWRWLSGCS